MSSPGSSSSRKLSISRPMARPLEGSARDAGDLGRAQARVAARVDLHARVLDDVEEEIGEAVVARIGGAAGDLGVEEAARGVEVVQLLGEVRGAAIVLGGEIERGFESAGVVGVVPLEADEDARAGVDAHPQDHATASADEIMGDGGGEVARRAQAALESAVGEAEGGLVGALSVGDGVAAHGGEELPRGVVGGILAGDRLLVPLAGDVKHALPPTRRAGPGVRSTVTSARCRSAVTAVTTVTSASG